MGTVSQIKEEDRLTVLLPPKEFLKWAKKFVDDTGLDVHRAELEVLKKLIDNPTRPQQTNEMWNQYWDSRSITPGSLQDRYNRDIAQYGEIFGFLPSDEPGLKLWCRYDKGITVTGSGVSQWDDQSGNGNHLKQGTDTNRPSKEAAGSILFDGVDNFLKADAFTLNQPETVYLLGKQITWTAGDRIFDGNTLSSMALLLKTATPTVAIAAGLETASSADFALGTYAAVVAVFNNGSSILQVNNNTPTTGDTSTTNAGGFVIGARGAGAGASASNLQVKEVIVYSAAHDAATRAKVIKYLGRVGNLLI